MKDRTFHGTKMTDEAAMRKDRTRPTTPRWQHAYFAEIARIISELFPTETPAQPYRRKVAQHFADELAEHNERFFRQRFLIACGVEAEYANQGKVATDDEST